MNQSKKTKAGRIWMPTPEDCKDSPAVEKARFAYDNAVLFHEGQIKTAAILQAKGLVILGFVFSLTWLVISKTVDFLIATPPISLNIQVILGAILLYCLMAILCSHQFILDTLSPKERWCSGNEPNNSTDKKYFNQDLEKIYLGQCLAYQDRIDHDKKLNDEYAKKIQKLIKLLINIGISLVMALISFLSQFWSL